MLTYTIRLNVMGEQEDIINELSLVRNTLYNKLIDIQENEYKTNGKTLNNYGLDAYITEIRKDSFFSKLNSRACQCTSKGIYSAYLSFFELIKKDKTARPPRKIENVNEFKTITYNQSGWSFKPNNIVIINKIKLSYSSHLKDIDKMNIKEVRLKKINGKYLLDICIDDTIEYKDVATVNNKVMAIDLGLKTLGTCVDNKGNVVVIKNKAKKINKYYFKQIAKVQQKMASKKKKSKKYNKLKSVVSKLYSKKNSQIKHALHTQSKQLLSMNYRTIVVGDLSIKKLMSDDKSKYTNISKSFAMSNIAMFVQMLSYKAHRFNTEVVKINEQYTTQTNCLTGKIFKEKVELSQREVKLNEEIIIDRDLNASINILKRYFNNTIAPMTEPLDVSSVIRNFNIMNKSSFVNYNYI